MTSRISLRLRNDAPTNLTIAEASIIIKILEKIDARLFLLEDNSVYLSLSQSYEPAPGTNDPELIYLIENEYLSLRIAMIKIIKALHDNNIDQLQIRPKDSLKRNDPSYRSKTRTYRKPI